MIHQLVNDSPCVILGRCADYILSEQENHYSFFIYADDDYRASRGKTTYAGKSLKELNAEDKNVQSITSTIQVECGETLKTTIV